MFLDLLKLTRNFSCCICYLFGQTSILSKNFFLLQILLIIDSSQKGLQNYTSFYYIQTFLQLFFTFFNERPQSGFKWLILKYVYVFRNQRPKRECKGNTVFINCKLF